MGPTATTATHPWTIDPAAVREAAISVATDGDALDFASAAIELGASDREADLLDDLIATTQMRAHGCV